MGTIYSKCCKSSNNDDLENREYKTKPYIKDDIFKTMPPCKRDFHCDCPCHGGGKCLYVKIIKKNKIIFHII